MYNAPLGTNARTSWKRIRGQRAGDQQPYQDYLARRLGPSVPKLTAFAAGASVFTGITGTVAGFGSPIPWWLQLLPVLALMAMAALAQRARGSTALSVLAVTCVGLLETAFNLQGLSVTPGLPWMWPATLLVPVASAIVWLRTWDFTLGMLLSAAGPMPMLLLNAVDGPQLSQYLVFMAVAVALSVVLRAFITDMMVRQFRSEQQLREQATTDGLSGLLSRNCFMDRAATSLDEAWNQQKPSCLLYLDVDRFKVINDNYGHAAGDAALVALAATLRAQSRETDLIGRIGGEEFALVLPGASIQQARSRAEHLRRAVHAVARPDGWLTVSIGLAECAPGTRISMEHLLARADHAMRQAKQNGRDQVVVMEPIAVLPQTDDRNAHCDVGQRN